MAAEDNPPRHDCCCDSPRLTRGEISVLLAIAAGLTSKQAASMLRLSRRTVDGHIDAMRAKARVATRGELLAVAVSGAIIDLKGGTPRWTGRSCLPRNREKQRKASAQTAPGFPSHYQRLPLRD